MESWAKCRATIATVEFAEAEQTRRVKVGAAAAHHLLIIVLSKSLLDERIVELSEVGARFLVGVVP